MKSFLSFVMRRLAEVPMKEMHENEKIRKAVEIFVFHII